MKKRSFTLIELLIVLVIIGIVATLAVPQYKLFIYKAQCAETKQGVAVLANGVWMYYLETGRFPSQQSNGAIPADLGISFSTNQTKYFNYTYWELYPGPPYMPGTEYGQIFAMTTNNEILMRGPEGATTGYRIWYMYDTPTYMDGKGQKIGNHWYRYYQRLIWPSYWSFEW